MNKKKKKQNASSSVTDQKRQFTKRRLQPCMITSHQLKYGPLPTMRDL